MAPGAVLRHVFWGIDRHGDARLPRGTSTAVALPPERARNGRDVCGVTPQLSSAMVRDPSYARDMPVTLELTPEVRARLEAEAARRGVTLDQLIAEFAAGLPAPAQPADGNALDSFFGSGDSGDPTWATRDVHELRHELAGRRQPESR